MSATQPAGLADIACDSDNTPWEFPFVFGRRASLGESFVASRKVNSHENVGIVPVGIRG